MPDGYQLCPQAGVPEDPANPPSLARMAHLADVRTTSSTVGFRYDSIMLWKASWSEETRLALITKTNGLSLYFRAEAGSSTARRVGPTQKDKYLAELLGADFKPVTDHVAYIKLAWEDGTLLTFSAATGEVVTATAPSGAVITAESYNRQQQITYNSSGEIESIWSETDGLLVLERTVNSLTVSRYPASQIVTDPYGRHTATGEAFKTWRYNASREGNVTVMEILEQRRGQPAMRTERRINGGHITIIEGEGDERIETNFVRSQLPGGKWEQIKTVRHPGDETPASCERLVKQYTSGGWLTQSITNGYGSPAAVTTLYTYDEQYRVSLETRTDGWYARYGYDELGRVATTTTPWGDGSWEKVKNTSYADLRFYDNRVSFSMEYLTDGTVNTPWFDAEYLYEDSPQMERLVSNTQVAVEGQEPLYRTTIRERYGPAAPIPYSRGRIKMEQDIDGVQTVYTYENTAAHGATWKVTSETRVNGAAVNGQSRRTVRYIALNETITREENYLNVAGSWILASSSDYEYDPDKNITRTTNGNGRVSTAEWTCCGPLRETGEDGVTTSYGYNSARQLIETIRSATATTPETITCYTRDAAGRTLARRTDTGPLTTTETTAYDILGRVTSQTDVMGRTTNYAYSTTGLRTTTTLPTGAVAVRELNADGTIKYESQPGARPVYYRRAPIQDQYAYHSDECLDANGTRIRKRSTIQSATGDTLSVQLASIPAGELWQAQYYDYNAKGQVTLMNNRGVTTLYEYDSMGNATRETVVLAESPDTANSKVTAWRHACTQLPDGVYQSVTTTVWGTYGDPLNSSVQTLMSQLSPVMAAKTIATDMYGNATTEWTEYGTGPQRITRRSIPTSNLTAEILSIDGFTVSRKDNIGGTDTYERTWLATGTRLVVTDPRGNAATTLYNPAGWPVSASDAAGNTTTYQYNTAVGQPSVITDALGHTTCYNYDVFGRKTAEYGTGIQPALFGYDEEGNLASLTTFRERTEPITTDPSGRGDGDTTTWQYAWQEPLVLRKTYADASSETTSYGAFNRMSSFTNARGITAGYEYDALSGLPVSVTYSDETPGVTYHYDNLLRLVAAYDGGGMHVLEYDAYNRLWDEASQRAETTYYTFEYYDGFGRPLTTTLSIMDPDAGDPRSIQTSRRGYASNGQIASVVLGEGNTAKRIGYDYLAGTNLHQTLALPNGITRHVTYERQRNIPDSITCQKQGAPSAVVTRTQSSNELGYPVARSSQKGSAPLRHDTFGYNDRGELELAEFGSENYHNAYDNIGNRTMALAHGREYSYYSDSINQYTDINVSGEGNFIPAYDADGNQTKLKSTTGIWNVEYNAENRPVRFTSEDGATVIDCGYDYMGRRWYKKITVNGVVTRHEEYMYRGYLQVAAFDMLHNGEVIHTLLWDPTEPAATRPLAITKDNDTYYYGWDFNKNVTELFDEQGNLVASYDYSPYGELLSIPPSGIASGNPLRFSSEYDDGELGLVYYNYRHYNPKDGRWISRDTIAEKGGLNLYGFIKNKPVGGIDFLGMCWSTTDALNHYVTGGGDIDLSTTGCVDAVTTQIKPQMKGWKNKARQVATEAMLKLSSMLTLEACEEQTISDDDSVGVHSGIWWIGGIALDRSYTCIVTKNYFACGLAYVMNDRFVKPFDLDNSDDEIWDAAEFGTPFFVYHSWQDTLTNLD